ncbi:hypothetical protein HYT51_01135 [Candidatus Woesearchaeota archaeon]|nr:hypothetical protein [Candidatus Woesearchaeota archaeon]
MKAQVSIELMIVVIVVVGIFSFILTAISGRESEFVSTRTTLHAKEVAEGVAFSINEVFLAGPNATRKIAIPETLRGNIPYNITYYENARLLYLSYDTKNYSVPLLTSNITGEFTKGNINISYVKGGITVNISDG